MLCQQVCPLPDAEMPQPILNNLDLFLPLPDAFCYISANAETFIFYFPVKYYMLPLYKNKCTLKIIGLKTKQ